MENKNYEIKKTGTEKIYGTAIRCSKEGKGRFDLIPEGVLSECFESYSNQSYAMFPEAKAFECALDSDYVNAVTYITQSKYHKCGDNTSSFISEFVNMVRDLAIHFQKGAEMYGERNCEKGIPLWSFRDSGIRHLVQYINGETDEPHYISAIWNFVMAEWTRIHHPERCGEIMVTTNTNETTTSPSSSDNKEKCKHNDYIDAVCYGLKHVDELMNKNTYNFDRNDDDKELFKECKSMFENDIVTRHIGIPECPWDNVKPDDLLSWENILNNIKGGISIDKEQVIKLDMHYPIIPGLGLHMFVPIDITIGEFYNKLFERICEYGCDSLDEIIIKATYPDGDNDEETTMNIRLKYVVRCDHNKRVKWCKSIFTNIDNKCEIVVYYNNKSDKGLYYIRNDKSGLIEKHTLELLSEVFELIRGDVKEKKQMTIQQQQKHQTHIMAHH